MADLPPPENGNLRFILIDSYFDSSGRLGDRSTGRSTTPGKQQFQIHTDRFLLLRALADQVADQVADLPPYRHLVAKSGTNLGPVDLS